MTDIFEYRKARNEEIKKKEKTSSEQLFLDNIGHIETITNTKGYNMIKRYWITEWNNALNRLSNVDINDTANLAKEKAKLELATTFITYLTAHEKGLS